MSWLDSYHTQGWAAIPGYFSKKEINSIYDEAMRLREELVFVTGWSGVGCASYFSDKLYKFYTCRKFYELSRQILGAEVYLFNDELVIKYPKNPFLYPIDPAPVKFDPHYDNWFSSNRDNKIHTVNCYVIMDDITRDNGGIVIVDKNKYGSDPIHDIDKTGFVRKKIPSQSKIRLPLKKGDVLAIRGDTWHCGGLNRSDNVRAAYACVFTEKPIKEEIHFKHPPENIPKYFRTERFDNHSGEILQSFK